MNISFDLIIADETIELIRESGNTIDQEEWFLGDQVTSVYATLQKVKSQIVSQPGQKFTEDQENKILAWGEQSVITWVSDISGRSVTSVTRYYHLAKFYNPDIRDQYWLLPNSHYEWAMSFPDYAEEILEVGVRLAHKNNGRPVPLRVMQALFRSVDNIPEVLKQLNEMEELDDVLALADYDQNGNGTGNGEGETEIPPLVFHFLSNIGNIAKYIRAAVNLWDIDNELKTEIVTLVRRLAERVQVAQFGEPEKEKVDTKTN